MQLDDERANNPSKKIGSAEGDIEEHGTITPEDVLYSRTIRTIHTTATQQLSLVVLPQLMELQFYNGLEVSMMHCKPGARGEGGYVDWLEAGARVWRRSQRERAANATMLILFPNGVPYGMMGDGSNDASLREQEANCLRFIGADGRPYNEFYDLAELDLADSHDGHSPDAQCITSCYKKSLAKMDGIPVFLFKGSSLKALKHGTFDGATVMLGKLNGVSARLQKEAPQAVFTHAAAHVTQLCLGAAFAHLEYYDGWKKKVQAAYIYYSKSGKKRGVCWLSWRRSACPGCGSRAATASVGRRRASER